MTEAIKRFDTDADEWFVVGRLIRCNECKYYIADGCDECALMTAKSIIAGINNKRWYSDFYCAWGERKEE